MEQEFDFNEMSDEDIEAYLDCIIETEFEPALEEAKKPHIINPKRFKEFVWAYKTIERALKGSGAKVSGGRDDDFSEMGNIEILCGTSITFKNAKILYKVGMLADNFCIIPKTNNTFYMTFTFYGITDLIPDWEEND